MPLPIQCSGAPPAAERGSPMTLTVTVDLTPEQEAALRDSLARHEHEHARHILSGALIPTLETLFEADTILSLSDDWDNLLDHAAALIDHELPLLPDERLNRAGIYGDHA
jgi:hypothetical protein